MAPSLLSPVAAALAYPHDKAVQNVLTDDDLKILLPLDLSKAESAPSLCSLGLLGNLPPELIIAILDQLSLLSLIRFRNASRHARFFVDSMPMFRTIMDHAPQAIRGILAVQTKIEITLPQVFHKLRQRHCDHCGELAQRLWLPTVSRLCFKCGQSQPRPLKSEELIERSGLTSLDLASIPSFYFHPARFTNGTNYFQVQVRHTLYDTHVAVKLCERTGKTFRLPGFDREDREVHRLLVKCSQREPLKIRPDLLPVSPRRCFAMVDAPWLSPEGTEFGVFCAVCLYTFEQDRIYAPSDFEKHLETCRVGPYHYAPMCYRSIADYPFYLRLALK